MLIFSLLLLLGQTVPTNAPQLGVPIDCAIGEECFIQQYPDHDPGPAYQDYRCGQQSYDGHTGTDFRIRDLAAMARGVDVLAAASGMVVAVRDGEPDVFMDQRPPEDLQQRGCGNGIVIDHGEGWRTYYCHLKRGSLQVGIGDQVTRGEAIAEVGLSGLTEFPHLEFVVRHATSVIDPFVPSGDISTCGVAPDSPWQDEALRAMFYQDTKILNAGFATAPVTMRDIEEGMLDVLTPTEEAPALIVVGRMINAREGDRLRLTLKGPGDIFVEKLADPAPNHQAQRMAFAGIRQPKGGWPVGRYEGKIEVVRVIEVTDFKAFSLDLD